MKKMYKILAYNGFMLCGIFLLNDILIAKDIAFSKKYEWNYTVEDHAIVNLRNYDCDINIESTSSNEVRFEIQVDVESTEQEDINILNNYLESLSFPSRSDMVKLETMFWENRNSNNSFGKNVIKMKLKNGESIKLSEFKIKATLQIPSTTQLELQSKYSNIELGSIQNLTLNSYDDNIYGKNVAREVTISAKYSDLEFIEFGPTDVDIYDCHFTAEKTEDLTIRSKYSDITINRTGNIDIDGYDDSMNFKITGDINLKTKYSDLSSTSSGNLTLEIYDSDFEIEEIGNLTISESKYSGYKFKKAGIVNISISYDDEYNIDNLVSFETNSSKYSDFTFSNLDISFDIFEGYHDNIKIYNTSSSFTHLDVNCKYGDITLRTSAGLPLKIDWKTKYGNIDFDESKFNTSVKIKENSEYEYQGIRGNESANMPFVKVRGYDVKMKLND